MLGFVFPEADLLPLLCNYDLQFPFGKFMRVIFMLSWRGEGDPAGLIFI